MIIATSASDDSRTSVSQNICAHTIRDEWFGMALVVPQASRNADEHYNHLEFFGGIIEHTPDVFG